MKLSAPLCNQKTPLVAGGGEDEDLVLGVVSHRRPEFGDGVLHLVTPVRGAAEGVHRHFEDAVLGTLELEG
jgi:hypothetical protein